MLTSGLIREGDGVMPAIVAASFKLRSLTDFPK